MLITSYKIRRSIGSWWSTVHSEVVKSPDFCGTIIITVNIYCTASRNFLSIIYLIKERFVLFRSPSISWKFIVEAIKSKLIQKLYNTNQFVIVVSLNPITKCFPSVINNHFHSKCRTWMYTTTPINPEHFQC